MVLDDLKVDLSFCASRYGCNQTSGILSREQALAQLGGVTNAMSLAELVAGAMSLGHKTLFN